MPMQKQGWTNMQSPNTQRASSLYPKPLQIMLASDGNHSLFVHWTRI
ncbi:hypothetical protein AALP_AA2G112600 [Arabis alpina]|uniref:Uncharacterized protein n=1 Tax=Arabis alpina TaxID=50452 RepID=A0A087HGQ0_ARAAL|nr:hypothetical protein AALP_AA2G112600 [Arabis alpina]